MRIEFWNVWKGCSLKPGEAFPFDLIEIYADFNRGYRFFQIIIFNFGIILDFKKVK